MPRDLTELVRELSPAALSIFKRQLAALPEQERQKAFSRLSGISELTEVVGRPSIVGKLPAEEPRPQVAATEAPLWQRAVQTATAPFRWIEEKITQPFGAIVTSPFTPGVAGTEGLPWYQRELAEYKAWEDPTIKIPFTEDWRVGVKGVVETLPWFAIPSAAGIAGKLGMAAAKGGALGRAAGVAGRAIQPAVKAERALTYPITKPLEILAKRGRPPKVWGLLTEPERVALAKEVGLSEGVASKTWKGLTKSEQTTLSERILRPPVAAEAAPVVMDEFASKLGREAGISVDFIKKPWRESKFTVRYKQPYLEIGTEKIPKGLDPDNFKKILALHEVGHKLGVTRKAGLEAEEEAWNYVVRRSTEYGVDLSGITKVMKNLHPEYGPGAVLGKFIKPEISRRIVGAHNTKGGATFDLAGKNLAGQNIFAVGAYPGRSIRLAKEKLLKVDIDEFAFKNSDLLKQPRHTIGTWFDRETGNTILDISVTRPNLESAMALAQERGQKAIFNLKTMEEIPVEAARIAEAIVPKVTAQVSPPEVWGRLDNLQRAALAKVVGIERRVDWRKWATLTEKEQEALSSRLLQMAEEPTATLAMPAGFTKVQQEAVEDLTRLVKETKSLPRETAALRRPEQAARIGEYERLLQQYRAQGVSSEQADNMAIKALAGKYPEAEVSAIAETIRAGMSEGKVKALFDIVADAQYASGFTRRNTFEALQNLLLNNKLQEGQMRLLEETFGSRLVKEILRKRPWGVKAKELTVDILNAPRALLASADISGLLRQGGILMARHPIEGLKTVRPMLRAIFSDKYTGMMDDIIRTRAGMDELLSAGLEITAVPTRVLAKISEREEAFASQIMNKIFFIKASNRAYTTVLNDMRSRSALNVLNAWKKAGIQYTKVDLEDLARLTNWASGRGTLPFGLGKQGGLLNAMLFSPKLIMSRLQFPTAVLPMVTKSALVRREAWRELLSFVGAGSGILMMAKLSGASEMELDPRSADFGKIKVGETRLDIWTGYLQYIRFFTQFAIAERKTISGRMQTLNRKEVIDRFIQTKLSPGVGFISDLIKGESYLGEELPPKSAESILGQAYQRMMPLAIQDLIDGVSQEGPLGGIVASVGLLGVGVVTYTSEVKKERDKAAEEKYGMSWAEVGQRYGRAAQLHLEQTTPTIIEAEQEQEERFGAGSMTAMQQWHREGQSIEDTYRGAIDMAVQEFRQTRDGRMFRDKVDEVAAYRRRTYQARAEREEYQDIIAYYNQPLEPDKIAEMNPGDILRREFYQQMFSPDMYDQFGNYLFDEAERREQEFLKKYGQQALDYIEEYRGSTWVDKPVELRMLEQARDTLRPYWQVTDMVWDLYPAELKVLSDQIFILENTNPTLARQLLRGYPSILRARELIAQYKKMMRDTNLEIKRAYQTFYG